MEKPALDHEGHVGRPDDGVSLTRSAPGGWSSVGVRQDRRWTRARSRADRPVDLVAHYVAALAQAQRQVLAADGDLAVMVGEAVLLFEADAVAVRVSDSGSATMGRELARSVLDGSAVDRSLRVSTLSDAEAAVLRTSTAIICSTSHGPRMIPRFAGQDVTGAMVGPIGVVPATAVSPNDGPTYGDSAEPAALVIATTHPDRRFNALDLQVLEAFCSTCASALSQSHRVAELQRGYEHSVRALGHDALTGLPNRTQFLERLDAALERFSTSRGRVGVVFIDLDDFKLINDRYGHETGDRLLIAFAARLQRILRPGELGARLAGDEFVVLLDGIDDRLHGHVMVERIRIALSEPFQLGDVTIVAEASFGLAFVDDDRLAVLDAASLLRDADVALYRAKSDGKARSMVFDKTMRDRELADRELASRLRNVVRSSPTDGTGQLELHYQPIVELSSGAVTAVEALLRWHNSDGDIPPDDFIPVAEESGLIVALGRWVLEAACQQLASFRAFAPDLGISVNLSGRQLGDDGIVSDVASALEAFGLPTSAITLEVTETSLLERSETALARLRDLRRLGVKTALDDFGTGYSSLTSLRRFEFDVCKVDRAFIEGLDGHVADRELCEMLVNVGLHLGLHVVGEGIETPTQLVRLRQLGCQYGQGYHLGRPMPAAAMAELLAQQAHTVR